MMRFAILLCCFLVPGVLQAQSASISTLFLSPFEKAERMYRHLAYTNALELYLHVIDKNPENYVARQRAADCYFRLGNVEEAEKWYGELAQLEQGDPTYKYKYAQVLSIQGKYGDSEKWFLKYASAIKDSRVNSKLDFIYSISYYLRDSVLYTITPEAYNSDQSDFAPRYYKDQVIFVSARDRDIFIKKKSLSAIDKNESHLNVYYAPAESTTGHDEAEPFFNSQLNSSFHDGPITFFDSWRKVAFTRNNTRNGKPVVNKAGRVNLKLYLAHLAESGKLDHVEEFPFNHDDYSVGHPWVSENGSQLYFASDMPGGMGGVDLYKSYKQDGKWSKPQNLGMNINTMGNEFYPYVVNDSILYFTSDGHGGLGGLDLFVSVGEKNGHYQLPQNLGFPLNTSSDDFSMIINASGRSGLFSSNRTGGLGYDDIYKFKVNSFFLTGKVIDRADSSLVISEATVTLYDTLGVKLKEALSDENGIVHFDLDFDKDYQFSVVKNNYLWIDTLFYSTHLRYMGGDSLYLPLLKYSLTAKGTVYSNETQSILAGATVVVENLTEGTTQTTMVDSSGQYTFRLKPNVQYTISASKEGFITSGFKLNTKNIFTGDLINDLLLEEVFVEKAVVQFDFDKAQLRSDALMALEPMLKTLQRNKQVTLFIGAHADSYGTTYYNKSLSDRRAKSVLDFFTERGIARARIEAVGFGEELLLNQCSDGVECSDVEHSMNRRAEVKVQLPD